MNRFQLKLSVVICLFLFCLPCLAQSTNIVSRNKLFAQIADDDRLAAVCERNAREYQLSQFGRVFSKISGHCWDGCPVQVAKPFYPAKARQFKVSEQVRVETIVDENGRVIYAETVSGNYFLRRVAVKAALLSRYTPKKICGNKLIKFRWIIVYNFHQ